MQCLGHSFMQKMGLLYVRNVRSSPVLSNCMFPRDFFFFIGKSSYNCRKKALRKSNVEIHINLSFKVKTLLIFNKLSKTYSEMTTCM